MKRIGLILTNAMGLIALLCSCSGSILSPSTKADSFSYNFTDNGCSTGEKTFNSNDAMCNALKSDSFNNYCAQSMRYQKFQSDCPGKTW